MKIGAGFVKIFLSLFLLVILANIVLPFLGLWNQWAGWAFVVLLLELLYLILRKKIVDKDNVFALSVSIIFVIIIVSSLIFFVSPTIKLKYSPLDVVASNASGLPMNIYFNQKSLFSLSGWESKLSYSGKEDRINGNRQYKKVVKDENGTSYFVFAGDNAITLEKTVGEQKAQTIGWFYENNISISESKTSKNKFVVINSFSSNDSLSGSQYNYTFYKNKPYFKIQFSATSIDPNKLGDMAYGANAQGYDSYLKNGTIKVNDNNITKLDKAQEITLNGEKVNSTSLINSLSNVTDVNKQVVARKGSDFKIFNESYEIFFNPSKNATMIIYSPDVEYFQNSFYWNVYWIKVRGNNGIYSPVYFIVLSDSLLKYDNGWQITSKEYNGDLEKYIYSSVSEMKS